jgi:hypothetical protein
MCPFDWIINDQASPDKRPPYNGHLVVIGASSTVIHSLCDRDGMVHHFVGHGGTRSEAIRLHFRAVPQPVGPILIGAAILMGYALTAGPVTRVFGPLGLAAQVVVLMRFVAGPWLFAACFPERPVGRIWSVPPTSRRRLRPGQRSDPARAVAILGVTLGLASVSPTEAWATTSVREGFDDGSFARRTWSLDRRNPPGVRIALEGGELRWQIPAGPSGRPPALFRSRCTIGGDFAVRASYRLASLPMPREGWSNVEIFVSGLNGDAAVIRTNHATAGPGYSLWFEPAPGGGAKGDWKHAPTRDEAGVLELRRVGRTLRFAAGAGEPKPLGTVEFGDGEISRIEVRVIVGASREPTVVAFDEVAIEAERIAEPPEPADSLFGAWSWVGVGGAAAVAAAVVGLFIRRRSL